MLKTIWLAALALALGGACAAKAADLTPDQKTAICGQRTSCKVTATDAGQGARQEKLTVVEARFALADKSKDAPDEGCIYDGGDTNAPDHDGGHEFWLLDGSTAPKRLLTLCNDGYGSSGVGADDIKIGPNMITWDEGGGSAWRWEVTKDIRLSPLQVIHELNCSFNDTAPGTGEETEIDRRSLQARAVGSVIGQKFGDDDGVGCPDWPDGPDATMPTGPKLAGGYSVPMPNPATDGGEGITYPDGIALGDCALDLSTDGMHGFLVFGAAADAASAASVRVIKETQGSLLIQVYDPTAGAELQAKKAKTWVGQPHIEIWTSEPGVPADDSADQGPVTLVHQFAIGLDDKVYPGSNAFKPLPTVSHWAAKDEAGHDVTVYRVKWPTDDNHPDFGLAVVYSQAKDGKQIRLVSNAQIKKNKPLYLPSSWANAPEDSGIPSASCAVNADKILNVAKQL